METLNLTNILTEVLKQSSGLAVSIFVLQRGYQWYKAERIAWQASLAAQATYKDQIIAELQKEIKELNKENRQGQIEMAKMLTECNITMKDLINKTR